MKLQHKKFLTKKKIILILLAIVFIGSVTTYALIASHSSNKNNTTVPTSASSHSTSKQEVNQTPATPEQVQAGNNAKLNAVQQNGQQTNPNTPASFTIAITANNQTNSTVVVRSLISGVVSQSGTCTITVTNGAKSTTDTATTQALADSSTCQGFNIPISQLGVGTWNISLSVVIGSKSASTTKTITVN